MRDGFSSRLEHDRWFFEQAKLGSQKEKWVLKCPGRATKNSKTKNIARQSGPINLLVIIIIIIITEYISQSASSLLFS